MMPHPLEVAANPSFLSRRQQRMAIACHTLEEIDDEWKHFDVIGIDEGQFFEDVSSSTLYQ